ncbi:unnamed protein product [Rhizoctonia solani]|uniref:Uncharacterized protein n=1 Tax=Rhizoctonia solani TaxID=456999 RepID=A0A8H3B1U0_9AGAM|nr:unnamed protein product [Rhizoctonia solani]CAE6461922.1 unnamed protein product [Rhizoctonia solani]
MTHVERPRFNSYPTPISTTNYPPSSSKPYYTYAAATPTTTPTKSHPSPYHYRQASNSSQTRLAATPVSQTSSSRPTPRSSNSVPNPRTTSSSVPPPTTRSNPSSEQYSHSRKNSTTSRPQPPAADYRSTKREDERYASTRAQQHQQYADAQRQARLIAERDATLKRMEERQRKAQATSWFEESQRLAAEAARKQEEEQRRRADEERRRADEKLRRAAQAQAEEERRKHARSQERGHERGRSQTHNPAAAAADKKWYQNIFRDKSRDRRKDERPERERAKSEGRAREAVEARERVDKDRARNANSASAVATSWAAYDKTCSELMEAKPSKGKMPSNLTFYDIPWPVLGQANSFHDLTNQNIAAFLLSPHHSQGKSPKARLRAAILIWHPDKFAQKVLPHVAESHRPAVVAAVNVVARIVTELISSHGN